ncbi:unnamed protein product, partial [Amoebophrya sp. A120]
GSSHSSNLYLEEVLTRPLNYFFDGNSVREQFLLPLQRQLKEARTVEANHLQGTSVTPLEVAAHQERAGEIEARIW